MKYIVLSSLCNRRLFLASLVLLVTILAQCKKDSQPPTPVPSTQILSPPDGFPPLSYPDQNVPTIEGIALGRKLYYDSILGNGGKACASCHLQQYGFTSARPSGQMPILPHVNLAWKSNFMWDGSIKGNLEEAMRFEVEEFFATDIQLLNSHHQYPSLFKAAYNVETIESMDVARALAQFTRSMISGQSKYDRVMKGTATFTAAEQRGWKLYNAGNVACFHCHTPPLFTNDNLHNTGLNTHYSDAKDQGYYTVSKDSLDLGKFRTPTLRNVALRRTFMHDGRFSSLHEVVQFYNKQVQMQPLLDPLLVKAGQNVQLHLTDEEVNDMVAFLKTLTDSTYIKNSQWSKPSKP